MKKLNFIAIVFIGLFIFNVKVKAQVGIGTKTPDQSSILELKSDNQGLLLPRVNHLDSIKKPKEGLIVYDLDKKRIDMYKNEEWKPLETPDDVNHLIVEHDGGIKTVFSSKEPIYTVKPTDNWIRTEGGGTVILPIFDYKKYNGKVIKIIHEYSKDHKNDGKPVIIKSENRISVGTYYKAVDQFELGLGETKTFKFFQDKYWPNGLWVAAEPIKEDVHGSGIATVMPDKEYTLTKDIRLIRVIGGAKVILPILGKESDGKIIDIIYEYNKNSYAEKGKPVRIRTADDYKIAYGTYYEVTQEIFLPEGKHFKLLYNYNYAKSNLKTGWWILEPSLNNKEKSPQVVEVKNNTLVERKTGQNYFVLKPDNQATEINLKFPVPVLGEDNIMVEISNDAIIGSEYSEIAIGKIFMLETDTKVRYIKNSINGSTKNKINHWVEVQAIDNSGKNVALNKPITNSAGKTFATSKVTDGKIGISYSAYAYSCPGAITVDLGQSYQLKNIKIWHYYGDPRRYHDNIVQISTDGVNWTTIFDSNGSISTIKKINIVTGSKVEKKYIYNNFPYGKVLKFYYNNGWKTLTTRNVSSK